MIPRTGDNSTTLHDHHILPDILLCRSMEGRCGRPHHNEGRVPIPLHRLGGDRLIHSPNPQGSLLYDNLLLFS